MQLLIVLLTYNRLKYTKRTLKCLLDTVTVPHYIVAVDNNSTDGTQDWLQKNKHIDHVILNPENYYPGKAMNIAWAEGLRKYPQATHLMRLDNDMKLKPGWDIICQKYFKNIPNLGQLGYEHEAIEHPDAMNMSLNINGMTLVYWPGNIGGPCIISRSVWEHGLRYRENTWNDYGMNRPTPQEDAYFSMNIGNAGFLFGHTLENIGTTFANESNWKDYPEYYIKTMGERGYNNVYREQLDKLKQQSADAASEQE